jgi:hypothetical protein
MVLPEGPVPSWTRIFPRNHAQGIRFQKINGIKKEAPLHATLPVVSVMDYLSCIPAARKVFAINMAIVIGPTPPGTGVMNPATSFASAKQTSPTSR